MTKCHCCQSESYRYTFKVTTGRLAICEACFLTLPQKSTWQYTVRAAFKGV